MNLWLCGCELHKDLVYLATKSEGLGFPRACIHFIRSSCATPRFVLLAGQLRVLA